MPSPHLERKLKEVLGDDAGVELAAMTERIDPIRADIAELRQEIRASTLQFEKSFAHLEPLPGRVDLLVKEMHVLDKRIDKATVRLVMWSAGFWVAAVAAIAALAGVLRG
jgi:hypothetical protein